MPKVIKPIGKYEQTILSRKIVTVAKKSQFGFSIPNDDFSCMDLVFGSKLLIELENNPQKIFKGKKEKRNIVKFGADVIRLGYMGGVIIKKEYVNKLDLEVGSMVTAKIKKLSS